MSLCKRIGSMVLTAVLVVVTAAGCVTRDPAAEQARFEEFIQADFKESVESGSYSMMHQYFEHPENYGIDVEKMEIRLMDTSKTPEESLQEAQESLVETRRVFESFDRRVLTAEQQEMYDLYEDRLRAAERGNQERFLYVGDALNSTTGVHVQIPMMFSHIRILNETDVKNVLKLMESLPETFEWYLEYTREQKERGLMLTDLDEVQTYCQGQIDTGKNNTAFTTLRDKINALNLGADQTKQYQDQLTETFERCYLGAYRKLKEDLSQLKSGETQTGSLTQIPNGTAYYEEVLLPMYTGNGRSAEETIDLLEGWLDQCITEMRSAVWQNLELAQSFTGQFTTGYDSYQAVLAALEKGYQNDFPKLEKPLSYQVEDIPKEQRVETTMAYYIFNAMDASTPDEIRVNPTSKPNDGLMYTTIAHEGVPGHMYQYHYMLENKDPRHVFLCDDYLGYMEGYSEYVRLVSLDYLENLSDLEKRLYRASYMSSQLLSARLDIGLHYEGWDVDEMRSYLNSFGMGASAQEIYDSLCGMPPGFITAYGAGLAEFLELREYAEEELGSAFTKLGFHEAVLKSGSAPFAVVWENVEAYVRQVKIGRSTASY